MELKMFLILFILLLVDLSYSLNKIKDCSCKSSAQSRIIKGKLAQSGSHPWLVSIQYKNIPQELKFGLRPGIPEVLYKHYCMATIINEYWLLTAGHCVKKSEINKGVRIAYGPTKNLVDMKNYLEIEKVITHPDFFERLLFLKNDIALIKVKSKINFSKGIQPACLLDTKMNEYPGPLNIAGWGASTPVLIDLEKKTDNPLPQNQLLEGQVFDYTKTHPSCKTSEEKKTLICVDHDKNHSDGTCKGDSGSSLTINPGKTGKTYAIGVLSFARHRFINKNQIRLCDNGSAFTRLSDYMDWIREQIGYEYCS